ncbi:MAG TPA: exopolysaccharide biosynthesis protein [Candidatus Saccharimonadales bacterium]|nr:exopolysaccharide biosynthesis protein [Candidatus Saccharimonadales bacterium]
MGSKQPKFSEELKAWSQGQQHKTLGSLLEAFSRNGFAVAILLLMAVPALPLPTGGVTHIFELITMLIALGMIVGRRQTIWLPKRWQKISVKKLSYSKGLKKLTVLIAWGEKYTRPRLAKLMDKSYFLSPVGLLLFVLTLAAFLAPPFSGLDTLPSLGVVAICLSLIFSDFLLFLIGIAVGAAGVALILVLGSAIYRLF